MSDRVSIQLDAGVAELRLTRPDKLNALDEAMLLGIARALAELAQTPGLRAVVLSGEGRAFCAGIDLPSLANSSIDFSNMESRSHGDANLFQHVAWGFRSLPVPVIAALHGVAFGGGLQIASAADIRIARPDTRMSIMEMKWGLIPDMAGVALWRTLVREDVLRELTYTHREFLGEEAVQLGLVTRLAEDPQAQALRLAREIANKSPHAVRAAKRLYNSAPDLDAREILLSESREQLALMRSPNQIESVVANFEKRAPKFADV